MPQVGSLETYPRDVLEGWASKLNIPFKEADDLSALSLRLQLYASQRKVADVPPWAGYSPPAPYLAKKWKKPALLAWMRFLQLDTTAANGKSLTVKAMAAELSSFQSTLETPVDPSLGDLARELGQASICRGDAERCPIRAERLRGGHGRARGSEDK